MADIDLGVASDWDEGDTHGRVKLRQNQVYPNSPKKDVLISSLPRSRGHEYLAERTVPAGGVVFNPGTTPPILQGCAA
ncbi:DUF6342 family protein [Streptomyces flaveolus]|uniref:DUF6342 family protein n=1 Tax=Streptomyces flaveolus TaxID=67297 RepID=UPI00381A5FAE